MNERLNELRLDAGIGRLHEVPYMVAVNKEGEIIDPLVGLEKFAELLEKEFFSAGYIAGKSDGIQETVRECADLVREIDAMEIRKHFGVE